MILCTVRDTVPVVRQLAELEGIALLRVETEEGRSLLAADRLGAEPGGQVVVTLGESAQAVSGSRVPVDAAVVGLVER